MKNRSRKSDFHRRQSERIGQAMRQSAVHDLRLAKWEKEISPVHVPDLVAAVNGEIKAYEFRPDLPSIFPPPNNSAA